MVKIKNYVLLILAGFTLGACFFATDNKVSFRELKKEYERFGKEKNIEVSEIKISSDSLSFYLSLSDSLAYCSENLFLIVKFDKREKTIRLNDSSDIFHYYEYLTIKLPTRSRTFSIKIVGDLFSFCYPFVSVYPSPYSFEPVEIVESEWYEVRRE